MQSFIVLSRACISVKRGCRLLSVINALTGELCHILCKHASAMGGGHGNVLLQAFCWLRLRRAGPAMDTTCAQHSKQRCQSSHVARCDKLCRRASHEIQSV